MSSQKINLRLERHGDHHIVETVTREAFWNVNSPGCDEHYLVHVLRRSPDFIPELDLVAEMDQNLVGNIMYAKSKIRNFNGHDYEVVTFGPVSVLPRYQGMGIGQALIKKTMFMAKNLGHKAVLIYGDPDYYKRLGFEGADSFGISTREGLYSPALMAMELVPGWLQGKKGRFEESPVYDLDHAAAAEFDKSFPPKEKLVTPSQKRFQELQNSQCPV